MQQGDQARVDGTVAAEGCSAEDRTRNAVVEYLHTRKGRDADKPRYHSVPFPIFQLRLDASIALDHDHAPNPTCDHDLDTNRASLGMS